jgi:hypothetical protein
MPVILGGGVVKSRMERQEFDSTPAIFSNFTASAFNALLGGASNLSDEDIRELAGAPSGSSVEMHDVKVWGPTGVDRPPPGLYLYTRHPHIIDRANVVGICHDPAIGYFVYIKDVFYNDRAAAGVGAVTLARIVRFCLRYSVRGIALYGAGGRTWQTQTNPANNKAFRWVGYYFWPRCGFDAELQPADRPLLQYFAHPSHLSGCARISDVLQGKEGPEWWRVCGDGSFMAFDSSGTASPSVTALEGYLAAKGL